MYNACELLTLLKFDCELYTTMSACRTGSTTPDATHHTSGPMPHTNLSLSREWARATLASRSWTDPLVSAVVVSASLFYVSRRFDTFGLVFTAPKAPPFIAPYMNASKRPSALRTCPRVSTKRRGGELELSERNHAFCAALSLTHHLWSDFRQRSFKNLEHLGDTAMDAELHDGAISHHSTALSPHPLSLQGAFLK